MKPIRAILLPGAVLPAQEAYGALIEALGPDVQAVAKDLEIYADSEPPPGWSLDTEIDGVLRDADALGWETFHLAGYSGGGAAALAFAAKHPERLLSLALLEPDHFAGHEVDGGKKNHAWWYKCGGERNRRSPASQDAAWMKLRRIPRPTSWLFSGWN